MNLDDKHTAKRTRPRHRQLDKETFRQQERSKDRLRQDREDSRSDETNGAASGEFEGRSGQFGSESSSGNSGQFSSASGQFGSASGQFGSASGQFGSASGQFGSASGQLGSDRGNGRRQFEYEASKDEQFREGRMENAKQSTVEQSSEFEHSVGSSDSGLFSITDSENRGQPCVRSKTQTSQDAQGSGYVTTQSSGYATAESSLQLLNTNRTLPNPQLIRLGDEMVGLGIGKHSAEKESGVIGLNRGTTSGYVTAQSSFRISQQSSGQFHQALGNQGSSQRRDSLQGSTGQRHSQNGGNGSFDDLYKTASSDYPTDWANINLANANSQSMGCIDTSGDYEFARKLQQEEYGCKNVSSTPKEIWETASSSASVLASPNHLRPKTNQGRASSLPQLDRDEETEKKSSANPEPWLKLSNRDQEEYVDAEGTPTKATKRTPKGKGNEFKMFRRSFREGLESTVLFQPPNLCPNCLSSTLAKVKNLDLRIYQCQTCDHLVGEDDTMDPRYFQEKIVQGRSIASFSRCEHKNPNDHDLYTDSNGKLKARCRKCSSVVKVKAEGEEEEEEEEGDEDWQIVEADLDHLYHSMQCDCGIGVGDIANITDSSGNIVALRCRSCKGYTKLAHPLMPNNPTQSPAGKTVEKPTKSSVRFDEVRQGDHTCWDRPCGYSHHAIVIGRPSEDQIEVCHYSTPDSDGKLNGEIQIETLDESHLPKTLYRLDYQNCLSPDEVVARAKSRVGEKEYNAASNNCETFATWCKTGQEVSRQVGCIVRKFKCVADGVKSLFKRGVGSKTPASFTPQATNPADIAISIALLGAKHVVHAANTMEGLHLPPGDVSRSSFLKVVIREVIQGTGGLVGTVIGGILGTIYIPIVGTIVGATVGGLVGEGLGRMIGNQAAKLVNDKQKEHGKY